RHPAPAYRKRNNLFGQPVRPGKKKDASSKKREDRHSESPERVHDNMAEQLPFQRVLQTAMATTAKGFGDRQRNGISPIGQIATFGKSPYRFFFFPNSSE